MATAISGSFKPSAYAVVLAYALILLSLWQVDLGLPRSSSSSPPSAASAPPNVLESSTLEPLIDQIAKERLEKAQGRRVATVALMVYAAGDRQTK